MATDNIILSEISLSAEPTPSQVANALRDMHIFLRKAAGVMLAKTHPASDPRMQQLIGTIAQLEIGQQFWDGPAQPQQLSQQSPRVVPFRA